MKANANIIFLGVAITALMIFALMNPSGGVKAQSAPDYGTYPFTEGSSSTTVDSEILAAPGASYRWVVTGVSYNILVEEADKLVLIEDAAGTPIEVMEFAPETQGFGNTYTFGEGVPCSVNSAVQVDVTSTTADIWVSVTAYKEYVPS